MPRNRSQHTLQHHCCMLAPRHTAAELFQRVSAAFLRTYALHHMDLPPCLLHPLPPKDWCRPSPPHHKYPLLGPRSPPTKTSAHSITLHDALPDPIANCAEFRLWAFTSPSRLHRRAHQQTAPRHGVFTAMSPTLTTVSLTVSVLVSVWCAPSRTSRSLVSACKVGERTLPIQHSSSTIWTWLRLNIDHSNSNPR
jgi:hypothetical protein